MRKMLRFLPAAAILAIALPALAQNQFVGIVTDDCTAVVDPSTAGNAAELYAFKVSSSGDCTDILFDLRATGGLQAGGADGSPTLWGVPPNWRVTQAPTDTQVAVLVYAPAVPNGGVRIAIDSDDMSTNDFGINARQTLGNSIPSSYAAAGLAGIDLTLPNGSATYGVKLAGAASSVTANFPQLGQAAATPGVLTGIEVAFAPLVEVNNVDWSGAGCTVAGRLANQATSSPAGNDGIIIGYNVYRVTGTAATVPTVSDFYNASLDADPATGWQYFMPMTTSFTLNVADPAPGAPGTNSPIDSMPNDLGGLQNADGVFGSGDEVMIFQDSAANRGTARVTGTAPTTGGSYWYAFQPVVCGTVASLATVTFSNPPGQFPGDHASSVSALAAGDDAIDLDLDGSIDFFSPQADAGLPGLGLTYNSLPALSAPVFADGARALPATGDVTLSGTMVGANVNIVFQTGLQAGSVQGFNVYRGTGDASVRVNEQLILAQGTESSVYQLVDDAVQARRLSKAGSVQYMVEIVYADGRTSLVGPFAVAVERQAPARRSR